MVRTEATPLEVLNSISVIEHTIWDYFASRDQRRVWPMHAVTVPSALWRDGLHDVGVSFIPNFVDDRALDFQIHRCRGSSAKPDPSWDACAVALSKALTKGAILQNRKLLGFSAKVIRTDRQSDDARRTGFNDCYTIQVTSPRFYVDEHGDIQDSPHLDPALHQAEV